LRRLILLLCAFVAAGCSTGPDESLRTVLVRFDGTVTDVDLDALREVGGSVQHRLDLAQSVSMRTRLEAGAYAALARVETSTDLGNEADPLVSVFVQLAGPPIPADAEFVTSLGATFVFTDDGDQVIAAVMPLSRVDDLGSRSRFIGASVFPEADQIQ
jgi:hypothetical protein